ncbi:hypothetical protein [Prosthecobacter sp.]|uniref:hypothetical protein n=1 Tax=Prosthecobacter sp. TaxID=1965333 RepID=UPI0037843EBA
MPLSPSSLKTRLLRSLACVVLLLAWPQMLHAHRDALIALKGTKLVGLPKNYAPAELDLKSFRLRIGKHVMKLPPFFTSLFERPHDLQISASWYHAGNLPPYVLIRIFPKKRDFSYRILLNLDTLDVIEFGVSLRESDSSWRELAIALSEENRKEIRDSIETVK